MLGGAAAVTASCVLCLGVVVPQPWAATAYSVSFLSQQRVWEGWDRPVLSRLFCYGSRSHSAALVARSLSPLHQKRKSSINALTLYGAPFSTLGSSLGLSAIIQSSHPKAAQLSSLGVPRDAMAWALIFQHAGLRRLKSAALALV